MKNRTILRRINIVLFAVVMVATVVKTADATPVLPPENMTYTPPKEKGLVDQINDYINPFVYRIERTIGYSCDNSNSCFRGMDYGIDPITKDTNVRTAMRKEWIASRSDGKEHGGWIIKKNDSYSVVLLPSTNSDYIENNPLPSGDGVVVVASFHTHTNTVSPGHAKGDYTSPSDMDLDVARISGVPVYMIHVSGIIAKIDPETLQWRYLANDYMYYGGEFVPNWTSQKIKDAIHNQGSIQYRNPINYGKESVPQGTSYEIKTAIHNQGSTRYRDPEVTLLRIINYHE